MRTFSATPTAARGFLPESISQAQGWDIDAHAHSCDAIAGDCFDVFPLPDGTTAILVADVTGHGPSRTDDVTIHGVQGLRDLTPAVTP